LNFAAAIARTPLTGALFNQSESARTVGQALSVLIAQAAAPAAPDDYGQARRRSLPVGLVTKSLPGAAANQGVVSGELR
jgi:hypothetical protein